MKSISVIIPTYQHALSIDACIRSILQQTQLPLEVIVVDDGSTDTTKEIVAAFGDRVIYVYQSNQGAPVARNTGASMASGELLIFCDADVVAHPILLEKLAAALEANPIAAYAYCGFYWGRRAFYAKAFDALSLRQGNSIHTTSLIRRDQFPGFDPSLKRFQDWDLWLTMLEQGQCGVAVPEVLFCVSEVAGRKGISTWLPSFVYRVPWHLIGWKPRALQAYEQARAIIVNKHHLPNV